MRSFRLLVGMVMLSGCATIITGTTQEVSFHSNPEGATVMVDGTTLGKTPLTFPLKKDKYDSVTFTKDGYKTLILPMQNNLNGWFWGNIVIGGFIGSTTDSVSGAIHQYSPGQYMVSLEPLAASKIEVETSKDARQKAREFIVMAYSQILRDLSTGQGEYLRSLFGLLEIRAEEQVEAIKKLRSLSEVYTNILEFADHAIDIYLKPSSSQVERRDTMTTGLDGADWPAVQFGAPEVQYRYLVGKDAVTVDKAVSTMTSVQKTAFTKFILHEKGKRSGLGWGFDIDPKLEQKEKEFIMLYLTTHSDFKPRF